MLIYLICRWLRYVSLILFINKTDLLEEKILAGKSLATCIEQVDPSNKYYQYFKGYRDFIPSGERYVDSTGYGTIAL